MNQRNVPTIQSSILYNPLGEKFEKPQLKYYSEDDSDEIKNRKANNNNIIIKDEEVISSSRETEFSFN